MESDCKIQEMKTKPNICLPQASFPYCSLSVGNKYAFLSDLRLCLTASSWGCKEISPPKLTQGKTFRNGLFDKLRFTFQNWTCRHCGVWSLLQIRHFSLPLGSASSPPLDTAWRVWLVTWCGFEKVVSPPSQAISPSLLLILLLPECLKLFESYSFLHSLNLKNPGADWEVST